MLGLITSALVAGIVATTGMTAFLSAVNRSGWTNADMVRAVGGLFTKSYHDAFGVGMAVHFINGIIIALIYLLILDTFDPTFAVWQIFLGGIMGFAQGFVVGWAIIRFAYRHPVEEFQKADYQVAIAHIAAHVVYGLLIGGMYAVMQGIGVNFDRMV